MTNQELSPAKRALLKRWLQGRQSDSAKPVIPRRPPDSPVLLSFPQQRQLFLELFERGTAVNNLSVFLKLKGDIDLESLEKSANLILKRHDVLRTSFSFGQGLPAPIVKDELKIRIPIVDLQNFEIARRETEARRLAEAEVLKPFDLSLAPLIRLKLYQTSEQEHSLFVIVHHTIADGWSFGVFLKELMAFYQANISGKHVQLPELPIQYADYAYWQSQQEYQAEFQKSLAYWKIQLGGELPILELPTDKQRTTRRTYAGGTYRFVVSNELTEALEQIGRSEDSTLFMTLSAVFNILLHRYSGQNDILIGTPVANRNLPDLEPLIGVFINTLVLRTGMSEDQSFRELLRKVRKVSLDTFAHQNLPFEKLVEELKPRRDLSRSPLFQVVFNLQNAPMPDFKIEGLETSFLELDTGVSQFDLTLMVSKKGGQCEAVVEYNKYIFEPSTIERMFSSFQMLLGEAISYPDQPISRLQYISPTLIHHLIHTRNQTQLNFPREKCFPQLFEEQVERTPGAIAVVFGEKRMTYDQLNRSAYVLANQLLDFGVTSEIRVGVLMNRSSEMLESLLAVLKAGGTYIPIHTSLPKDRIKFILRDAQAHVLVTNLESGLPDGLDVKVIHWNGNPLSAHDKFSNPHAQVSPDQLAYIIYTSGSTGNPKGVMVNHSSLANFLWSMLAKPGINKGDVLMAVTSISFDIAALELFLPLIAGATVVIATEEMLVHPPLFAKAIDEYEVSLIQATPAIWQILIDSGWKGRRDLKALCGGDALTRKLADDLLEHVGSLWNMYGPTETTIWSSVNLIQKNSPITLGNPIGNTQLYILDCYQQTVPIHVVGELHIGGEGLARAYLNLPNLTEEKFIPDPFSSISGARLYKTGDLARYLADGSIEILGRMDDQVKINGNRMELGEIQAVLLQHPSLNDGIVIARTESSGEKRLVAYFVPKINHSPSTQELREFLVKKLPSYMIPSFFINLPHLPLTGNGKINRKSLPLPEDIRQIHGYVAPRNEVEQLLTEIWQNVLQIEQVGIHDNFFDLGGASMQSLQMIAKANMFGLRVSIENIFEFQTIGELAGYISEVSD